MHNRDKFYELIAKIKDTNLLVIVEGKKDKSALENFGIMNTLELNKKPLYQIVEEIADLNKECVILTDLDKKGKELFGKLNSELQRRGIKIDNKLREFLFRHTNMRQIEGITPDLEIF